jgi:predicted permease
MPLSGDNGKTAITPKGYVLEPGQSLHGHYSYGVNGDYFSALRIPLLEGRFLTSADSHRTERVCVVDEDFARRYWPNGSALGQQVFHGQIVFTGKGHETDNTNLFTIVGVVGAVKQAELTESPGQGAVYLPFRYRDAANIFVTTRTSQRPEAFAATLRKLVRATDPELAIDDLRSMETRIDDSLITRRSPALLAGIFATVALLLAALGTYGVLSYAVAQRRREIGIRMALGAQRSQIGTQFLSLGLRLLAAGTILGLIGAWLVGRAMQSVLFDVPKLPMAALLGTAFVMTSVSLVACLIPARRATRVDPMVALRYE